MRLLEVVAELPGLPVKAIARRSGLNLSTAYHLARTLAYEGYLRRLADGTYVVGNELSRRFYETLAGHGSPPDARSVLRQFVEATGRSAYLGRLNGGEVIVTDYVEGPASPYLEQFERGLNVSAHATALGKALMLAIPGCERRAFLRDQELRPFTSRTVTAAATLEAQLAALDTSSTVMEFGEFREDVACAARLLEHRIDGADWAMVVSSRGDEIPVEVQRELELAASLLGRPTPNAQ